MSFRTNDKAELFNIGFVFKFGAGLAGKVKSQIGKTLEDR